MFCTRTLFGYLSFDLAEQLRSTYIGFSISDNSARC